MNTINLFKAIKTIVRDVISEDAVIEKKGVVCSVCGSPADAKPANRIPKCPFCKNPYNWEVFDMENNQAQRISGTGGGGGGAIGGAGSVAGAIGAAAGSGGSGGSGGGKTSISQDKPSTDIKTSAPNSKNSRKIKKFSQLLQKNMPGESEIEGTNALSVLFKNKFPDEYNSIVNENYKDDKSIIKIIDKFYNDVKDIWIVGGGADPTNHLYGGVNEKSFATIKDTDYYRKFIAGKEQLEFFFGDIQMVFVFISLLRNRIPYQNALNSLEYDAHELTTFAESKIAEKINKKLYLYLKQNH